MDLKKEVIEEVHKRFDKTKWFYPVVIRNNTFFHNFEVPFKDLPLVITLPDDGYGYHAAHTAFWRIICEVRLEYGI